MPILNHKALLAAEGEAGAFSEWTRTERLERLSALAQHAIRMEARRITGLGRKP